MAAHMRPTLSQTPQNGCPKTTLPKARHHALSRMGKALVGRLHQDAEGFKVLPQRRRGIGEASMRKGVGGQQISEFIVDDGLRDGLNRQHGGAEGQGRNSDRDHRKRASLRQPREHGLRRSN